MNLLYITFGNNLGVHLQATFSICTFLCKNNSVQSINIITDKPLFYNHLGNKVKVIAITKEELQEWQGTHQFFWRIKLKAIEKICASYPNSPVMYLDTDTFLQKDATEIIKQLQAGTAFMHRNESVLSTGKASIEKTMWRQVKDKIFGGIEILPTDCMWNAGVVATPNTKQNKECEMALKICDEMCEAGVTRRLIEQFSLALALDRTYKLAEAKEVIVHYWTTKKLWDEAINSLLLEAYFSNWDIEMVLEKVAHFDLSKIPIDHRTKSTNVKLKKLVDKMYPIVDIVYLKN